VEGLEPSGKSLYLAKKHWKGKEFEKYSGLKA
jgi:hypothetical protein